MVGESPEYDIALCICKLLRYKCIHDLSQLQRWCANQHRSTQTRHVLSLHYKIPQHCSPPGGDLAYHTRPYTKKESAYVYIVQDFVRATAIDSKIQRGIWEPSLALLCSIFAQLLGNYSAHDVIYNWKHWSNLKQLKLKLKCVLAVGLHHVLEVRHKGLPAWTMLGSLIGQFI